MTQVSAFDPADPLDGTEKIPIDQAGVGKHVEVADLAAYVGDNVDVPGVMQLKGATDCSADPDYPAGEVGDAYLVSVAGKIGGASGKDVDVGDLVVAFADNAGGDEAAVGTSWFVLEHNLYGSALSSLGDLTDVDTAGVSDGDVLTYDSGSGDWVAAAPTGGGSYADVDALSAVMFNLAKQWVADGDTTPSLLGINRSVISGASAPSLALTDKRTRSPRIKFQTASSAGNQAGEAEGTGYNLNVIDGFTCTFVWGHNAFNNTGYRAAVGLSTSSSPGNVDPSSLTDCLLFASDAGDTNYYFMHNDGSGAATKVDTGLPANVSGSMFKATITVPPGGASVSYSIERLDSAGSYSATASTDLPSNTVFLRYLWWVSNGAVANNADIEMIRFGAAI